MAAGLNKQRWLVALKVAVCHVLLTPPSAGYTDLHFSRESDPSPSSRRRARPSITHSSMHPAPTHSHSSMEDRGQTRRGVNDEVKRRAWGRGHGLKDKNDTQSTTGRRGDKRETEKRGDLRLMHLRRKVIMQWHMWTHTEKQELAGLQGSTLCPHTGLVKP